MTERNYNNYASVDSMVYHNSMFLKKLSASPDSHHQHGWREKLGHFLESKPEQIFIFILIILDLLIVCGQLFIIEPAVKCETESHPTEAPVPHFFSNHTGSSDEPLSPYELADEILNMASLVILCILTTEMVLLLVAFDLDFFKQPLYILDALVISGTLFFEIFERGSSVGMYGNLVIFFRLWRVVRIVHGVAMSVQEQAEEKMKVMEKEIEKLKGEKDKISTKFEYIKKRYKKLVDAAEEEAEEEGGYPTTKRIRIKESIDDLMEDDFGSVISPSVNSTPSPFKSPGAPHMIRSHTSITINDGEIKANAEAGSLARSPTNSPLILPNPSDYNTFRRNK